MTGPRTGLPARFTILVLPGTDPSGQRGAWLFWNLRRRVRSRFARDSLLHPKVSEVEKTLVAALGGVKKSW